MKTTSPKGKKVVKAWAVMTNLGSLIEELREDNSEGYLIATDKGYAKKMLRSQFPPENWIVHPIEITIIEPTIRVLPQPKKKRTKKT